MQFEKQSKRMIGFFAGFLSIILFFPSLGLAASEYSAALSNAVADKNLVNGANFRLELKVSNNGTNNISSANDIYLQLDTNDRGWNDQRISLGNQVIQAGQSKTLVFTIAAPTRNGIYHVAWVLKRNNSEISNKSSVQQFVVESRENRVKFISQVVPENMKTGEENLVIVQFKNEGKHVWSQDNQFRLGFYGPDNKQWDSGDIKLGDKTVVPPGEIASFRFNLMAPRFPGNYKLQWRMLKDRHQWFGEPTPELTIHVGKGNKELDAEFMHQTLPGMTKSNVLYSILEKGKVYPVTLTFKNSGTQPWLPGVYQLASTIDKSDLIWSVSQVALRTNEVIRPGQIKSFSFKIFAPLEPGLYDFQWQLRKGQQTWLGDKSEKIVITVK